MWGINVEKVKFRLFILLIICNLDVFSSHIHNVKLKILYPKRSILQGFQNLEGLTV